jgi:hypothetical protein
MNNNDDLKKFIKRCFYGGALLFTLWGFGVFDGVLKDDANVTTQVALNTVEKPVLEKGAIISYTLSYGDNDTGSIHTVDPKTKSCALALSEFEMAWAPVYHRLERTQKTGNYKASYEGYDDEFSSIPWIIKVTCTE